MASDREFYREIICFEVLSEEPIPEETTLREYQDAVQDGKMLGAYLHGATTILNGPEIAKLIIQRGESPESFGLTEEGEDSDTWREENHAPRSDKGTG